MLMSKHWTEEELFFLKENWGTMPMPKIAKRLNRTPTAIQRKVCRLHLGNFLNNGDYITFNQLLKALGKNCSNPIHRMLWVTERNFPIQTKQVNNKSYNVVKIEDFWKWCEHNQDILDLTKLEPLMLGPEPEWLENKRKSDFIKNKYNKNTPWTDYEDNQLINTVKEYKYTTKELANILHRTEASIHWRLRKLNCKYRPLMESTANKWTDGETALLLTLLKTETNWVVIFKQFPNHSEKAVKSKAYTMFKTQDLNKIKQLLSE